MSSKWKTLNGQSIPDIVQWVKDETREGQIIHIGTDSLQTGRYTSFVSVVVILNPPHGGRVAYSKQIVQRIDSLRERLTREVWMSVNLALEIGEQDISIHVDANPNEKYLSSRYVQELAGMVVGQGFRVIIKPYAWAATHAADHIVRLTGGRHEKALRGLPTREGIRKIS